MSRLLYTVQNLVDEVRSKLDEENTDSVDTVTDILPALNRAQDFAFDILARQYPEPLLVPSDLTLVGGTSDYDIPEDTFEDRIEKIEIAIPSGNGRARYIPLDRISYSDISEYESTATSAIPQYYCIHGRTIRIVPEPSGVYSARMWRLRNPEKLVLPQGRITVVNTASNYVTVDSQGSDLATEADQLGSYINFVDGQTGEIRGSGQIQILSNNRITIRTSPLRSTVLNRTISGALSTILPELDDYIAPIDGTCVPYYSSPVSNFMVQYAVHDLRGTLEGAADVEAALLEKLEKQVERTWVGRQQTLRIKKKNPIWGRPVRRNWQE